MSYSTNPVADAAAYYDARDAQEALQEIAEASNAGRFTDACRSMDANALAPWAPMVTDWNASRKPGAAPVAKRMQTLQECMSDALDLGTGPSTSEVMQLVLILAYSADSHANQARRARELVDSMARQWARHNTPEQED
jgi:putative protein kinase ArgK-like GTPase of G3E family